jgi:RNA polymerase sigma-70 factor, ECF subfamily
MQPQVSPPVPGGPAEDPANPCWSVLVDRVRRGEPSGMEDLYRVFDTGIRFQLCRQLGSQDLDDRVHDLFVLITESIRNGELRQPNRLMGYVKTVVRRQVSAHIHGIVTARRKQAGLESGVVLSDRRPDPERRAIERQNLRLALNLLSSLPRRDRDVLTRFYLEDQKPPEICGALKLSETQFRLIKSRAKARFGELGRARLSRRTAVRTRAR